MPGERGPKRRADDGAAGEMRLDDLALEILVEEIRGAHGPEAQRVVHALLAQSVEALAEVQQLLEVARLERGGIGRLAHQQRLDELALAHHIARVAVVGLGVALRVPRDLAAQRIVVVVERQVTAALHHGAAALVRDHLQAVLRQLERAHDLRAQQAAHVRAVRVREVLVQAPAHRRAADVRAALEHQHLEAGAREIAGRHQAVVAGADDDRVEPRLVRHATAGAQAVTLCVAPPDLQRRIDRDLETPSSVSREARRIVRRGDEPRLARVGLAQHALVVQHLRHGVVEGIIAALPGAIVARRLVREVQAAHGRMADEAVRDAARLQSTARMPVRSFVP